MAAARDNEDGQFYQHLWPHDDQQQLGAEFDPFQIHLPAGTIASKLRYLLSRGIIYDIPGGRCPGPDMKLITLKCLYAAMVGFNKDNLSLLYPNGKMGPNLSDVLLENAQGDSPSVRNRCCGHVFAKGETYYRCKYGCHGFQF
jgi:hypothetical protein